MTANKKTLPIVAGANPPITKVHKAAIILASLSPETASAIVQDISDAHLRAFARAFSELNTIQPQLMQAVAVEFLQEVTSTDSNLSGGIEAAKKILDSLADEERANRILSELNGGGAGSAWIRLETIEDQLLVDYLALQRLPIAAVILSKLPYEKTASLLAAAEPEFSKNVLVEISKTKAPAPEVADGIAKAIELEFLKPLSNKPKKGGSSGVISEIVNFLPSAKRDIFLTHLDEADPEVGDEVRKAVLAFEDLCDRLPEAGVAKVMREIDKDVLLVAIKAGEESAAETVEFLFGNISKRMVESYREEIAEMDDLTEEEGEGAQRQIVSIVRRLAGEGEFKLLPPKVEGDEAA